MAWRVEFYPDFELEFQQLPAQVQDAIAERMLMLEQFGPQLSRPYADTLKGSTHDNMKELRFKVDQGVWRVAFAFDPLRVGMLLAAGNKRGVNEAQFYRRLINLADPRFAQHLKSVKEK